MRSATSSDPLKALFAVQSSCAFTPENILVASAVPDWLTQLTTHTPFPRCTARIFFARLRRDGRPHPTAQYFPPPPVRGPDSGAAVGSAAGMTDCAGSAFLLASRKGAPQALLHNAQPRLCKNRRPDVTRASRAVFDREASAAAVNTPEQAPSREPRNPPRPGFEKLTQIQQVHRRCFDRTLCLPRIPSARRRRFCRSRLYLCPGGESSRRRYTGAQQRPSGHTDSRRKRGVSIPVCHRESRAAARK